MDVHDVREISVDFLERHLMEHTMMNYFAAVKPPEVFGEEIERSIPIELGTPPTVDAAHFHIVKSDHDNPESHGARITVMGRNLYFLKRRECRVAIFENNWEILSARSDCVIWYTKRDLDPGQIQELSHTAAGKKIISLLLVTAFVSSGPIWVPVFKKEALVDSVAIARLSLAVGKFSLLTHTLITDRAEGDVLEKNVKLRETLEKIANNTRVQNGPEGDSNGGVSIFENFVKILEDRQMPLSSKKEQVDKLFLVKDLVNQRAWGRGLSGVIQDFREFVRKNHRKRIEGSLGQTESKIYNRLLATTDGASHQKFSDWMNGAVDKKGREALQNRLKLFESIMSLQQIIRAPMVVAIVGPENSGKSTLINLLGGRQRAETGGMTHTSDVTGYLTNMEGSPVILVDFPGSDAPECRKGNGPVWRQFATSADIYLVVLRFTGDCKSSDEKILREVSTKVGQEAKIMLLVNQVDTVLKGKIGSGCAKAIDQASSLSEGNPAWLEYTPKKMNELGKRYKRGTGVRLDEMHFTVALSEFSSYPKEVLELRSRGVLVGGEITDAVRKFIRDGKTEHNEQSSHLKIKAQ